MGSTLTIGKWVLGKNGRRGTYGRNKIVRKDTDVVMEKTNADVVQK